MIIIFNMGRPTFAYIDLDALEYNYKEVRRRIGNDVSILSVVKANAYGHGIREISKELERLGVDFLGIAICEEGIELREAGIKKPILILNGIFNEDIERVINYNLTPAIYDIETAKKLSQSTNNVINIHVKIDTGMGRLGISPDQIREFFLELTKLKNINIEGIFSHLSSADKLEELPYTLEQINRFNHIIKEIESLGIYPKYKHIANSSAIIYIDHSIYNMVRPGLMLYGIYPSHCLKGKIKLKPVLSLKSSIIQLKNIPKGYSISYGRSFVTNRDSLIATIPIGYGDGYSRFFSNKGYVIIRGKRVPIVGVVCMDLIMVDVTDADGAKIGDEVVIIGKSGDCENSVEEMAEDIGTIPYEILCSIGSRIPRRYTKDGKLLC
jgi:alanine racemase